MTVFRFITQMDFCVCFSHSAEYSYKIFFLLSPTHGRCDRFTVRPVSDSFPLIFPVMVSKPCFKGQRCRKQDCFGLLFRLR